MYHFFVDSAAIGDTLISVTGKDYNHITHVLRMKQGEQVTVDNTDDGKEYLCEIDSFETDRVLLRILDVQTDTAELPAKILLFQGLPKADKMELIIQKAVELGASEVIPVEMSRSVVKLDKKKGDAKQTRWQAISEAAAKQSKRGIIPVVSAPVTYKEALERASSCDLFMVPYEDARGFAHTREVLSSIKPGQSVAILIGPEGGFAPSEIESAQAAGGEIITLGKRILRTETAGLVALSLVMAQLED